MERKNVTVNEIIKEGALYAARRKSASEKSPPDTIETSEDENGNSSTILPEDSLISERVEVIVQKSQVTLGILDGYYPTTAWHVGPLAELRWITSDRKFPSGMQNHHHWFSSNRGVPSGPVQVILIMGPFGLLPSNRWSCSTLQVVFSLINRDKKNRKRKLGSTATTIDNFDLLQETLHHGDCGGVTDARCLLKAMIKRGSNYRWSLPKTISNVLGNALVDTIGSGKPVDLPKCG